MDPSLQAQAQALEEELAELERKLLAREAPLRARLLERERAVADLEDEADGLVCQIQVFEKEFGGAPPSLFTRASRIARISLGVLGFFAAVEVVNPAFRIPLVVCGLGAVLLGLLWGQE